MIAIYCLYIPFFLLIDIHDLNFKLQKNEKGKTLTSRVKQKERVEMIWILGPLVPYDTPFPRLMFFCTPLISLQYPIFCNHT